LVSQNPLQTNGGFTAHSFGASLGVSFLPIMGEMEVKKMEKSIYEKGMKILIWGTVISAVLVSIITGFTLEKLLVCIIIGIVVIICWRLR
jgi:O-antigen/teichoic acid export membrane protein